MNVSAYGWQFNYLFCVNSKVAFLRSEPLEYLTFIDQVDPQKKHSQINSQVNDPKKVLSFEDGHFPQTKSLIETKLLLIGSN